MGIRPVRRPPDHRGPRIFFVSSASEASAASRGLGEAEIETLIQQLNSTSKKTRREAAERLGKGRAVSAVESLIRVLLDDTDFGVRTAAAESLGQIKSPDAVDPLIESLDVKERGFHSTGSFSAAVITALGEIGSRKATEPIVDRLEADNPMLRLAAAKALEKLRWQPPDADAKMRYSFAWQDFDALRRCGAAAVPYLGKGLLHYQTAKKSHDTLVRIGLGSVDHLISMLKPQKEESTYIPAFENVVNTLVKIDDPRVIGVLVRFLSYDNARYTALSAQSLAELWPASRSASRALVGSLRNGNVSACWIIRKDESVLKEGVSAILDGMIANPSSAGNFKKELFQGCDDENISDFLNQLDDRDRPLVSLLYHTRQSISHGMTDAGLGWLARETERKREVVQRVVKTLDKPEVIAALSALEDISPKELGNVATCIAATWYDTSGGLPYGAPSTTWAAQSHKRVTEDIRAVELAKRSVVVRLLVQQKDHSLPDKTTAYFQWSRAEPIKIDLSFDLWNEKDLPDLERLAESSEHEYYRLSAKKVQDRFRE